MKHKFHFDKATGTMVPETQTSSMRVNEGDVVQTVPTETDTKPVFSEERSIDVKKGALAILHKNVVGMQRVDKKTPVQLLDEDGNPESYLDSATTGIMMFREIEDYDICQITDEKTGEVLAYIGGYALRINFNMSELNSMEKIEQCLQGLVKLFRHKIMTQTFDKK